MANISLAEIKEWNVSFAKKGPHDILTWAINKFDKSGITLACSMGAEDLVLLDILASIDSGASVFFLDTGRLHEETYETLEKIRERYHGLKINAYFPNTSSVEDLVKTKGAYSFYKSLENRKECCFIRKVEPLQRALYGSNNFSAWVTGLRQEQSTARSEVEMFAWDLKHSNEDAKSGILKINPLLYWTWEEVLDFAKKNNVPLHPLHAKGYPSIGCQPCTRSIQKDEDMRAGRWWWENSNKECGLHI